MTVHAPAHASGQGSPGSLPPSTGARERLTLADLWAVVVRTRLAEGPGPRRTIR